MPPINVSIEDSNAIFDALLPGSAKHRSPKRKGINIYNAVIIPVYLSRLKICSSIESNINSNVEPTTIMKR